MPPRPRKDGGGSAAKPQQTKATDEKPAEESSKQGSAAAETTSIRTTVVIFLIALLVIGLTSQLASNPSGNQPARASTQRERVAAPISEEPESNPNTKTKTQSQTTPTPQAEPQTTEEPFDEGVFVEEEEEQEQVYEEEDQTYEEQEPEPVQAPTPIRPRKFQPKEAEEGSFDVEIELDFPSFDELVMWAGVRVGYIRKLIVKEGNESRIFFMKTLAIDPPIFEIPNYLSDEECKFIKTQGINHGLYPSDSTWLEPDAPKVDVTNDLVTDLTPEDADKLFRYSDQTWIPNDKLEPLIRRSRIIAQFSNNVFAEQLQVVKYRKLGHYESHTDSEAEEQGPCCDDHRARAMGLIDGFSLGNRDISQRCRLCRFATMLYYLQDVPNGGGTVFPLADNSDEELRQWSTSSDPLKFKQTITCSPGLVAQPAKGKAILWYSHKIDRGYLGALNVRSLHGGCNVYEGEKWISNHWFRFITHPQIPLKLATSLRRFDDY